MKKIRKTTALVLALVLLFSAAQATTWRIARDNQTLFQTLFDKLTAPWKSDKPLDETVITKLLGSIRKNNINDYWVARAIMQHWASNVLDPEYRMFAWREQERAYSLERSGLKFGPHHAFVVLGYQLQGGEMAEELVERCNAAAAAARSFPNAVLICTGGYTGINANGHTEAERMKEYLVNQCGIDENRIFMDVNAKTTMENAVNTFPIMKARGIRTYTLVTSQYHQLWSQIFFNAISAIYESSTGYAARMVGNYNCVVYSEASVKASCTSTLQQLLGLFKKGVETRPETGK